LKYRPQLARKPFAHVVGDSLRAQVEDASEEHKVDHVWITMDPGCGFRVLVSVNTFSWKNHVAGFDGRVRLAMVRGTWEDLPPRVAESSEGFSYEDWESRHNIYFEIYEKEDLEATLLEKSSRARLLEVWGTPYHRNRTGLHQIHSRKASCAVPVAIPHRDGALRFYFQEGRRSELLLFKFCGQD
jgi:hypothetical protein